MILDLYFPWGSMFLLKKKVYFEVKRYHILLHSHLFARSFLVSGIHAYLKYIYMNTVEARSRKDLANYLYY